LGKKFNSSRTGHRLSQQVFIIIWSPNKKINNIKFG
jgi:hypothetical protein